MTIQAPTRIVCPVDDCTWTFTPTSPEVVENTLASVFGPGVYAAVAHNQLLQRVERVVGIHMDGHKPVEFLRTITRLTDERVELLAAIQELTR